jgi:hypothetical protein
MPYYSEGQQIIHTGLLIPGDNVGVFDGNDQLLADMLVLQVHRTGDPRRSDAAKAAAPLETHWHTMQTVTEAGSLVIPTPTEPELIVPGGIFVGTDELALPFGHVAVPHARAQERGEAQVPTELLPSWRRLWQPEWTLRYRGHQVLECVDQV